MKPNPGGIITGDAIVDRDQEIRKLWDALENQSAVLTSERRVGKTSVLRKMFENPENGWIPILYLVEGKYHPIEFVEGLYELFLENDVVRDKFHRLKTFYTKYVGGEQIGSWKLPQIKENWKTLLDTMIEDIVSSGKKVLLMVDELPLMLSHFIKAEIGGPQVCMEFLDTLREIRNRFEPTEKFKFIFCGSIGIHLIIKDLKRNYAYNSDPINNMKIVTLSGMNRSGARLLCLKLSEDENYQFDNKDDIFEYICNCTDNLPFYIQHVFALFNEFQKRKITVNSVDEVINYLINDPKDEGFFNHYIDRIKTYYDKNIQDIALLILDKACKQEDYWKEDDILNSVKSLIEIDDETIKVTINLLWSDHYLIRKVKRIERSYKFKYSILQKWWKINRG